MFKDVRVMSLGLDFFSKKSSCSCLRYIRTSGPCAKKKDIEREAKLPTYDYNELRRDQSRIYVFGCSTHGAIGLRNLLRPDHHRHKLMLYIQHPVRHKFFNQMDVHDICSGHGFSLFAVKRKDSNSPAVFGCGLNELSQLGYQAARPNAPMERLIAPTGIALPFSSEKPEILATAAGRGHSVISVKNQGLITWGDNSAGQCARKIVDGEKYFGSHFVHRHSHFKSNHIVSIAARFDITVCLSQSGQVFTCGENSFGQLGRGKEPENLWDVTVPLEGDLKSEKIVKIATNGNSCLAVSEKGDMFGWGANEVGHIDPQKISSTFYEPRFVQLPASIGKVRDVSLGEMTTFVLNDKGDVYTWGHGPALGLGPSNLSVRKPSLIPPTFFGRNEFNDQVKVSSITAGFTHVAAINSLGDLFTWGDNSSGCLGLGLNLGRLKSQFFPLKVCLNGYSKKVALGVDHTIVLCFGSI